MRSILSLVLIGTLCSAGTGCGGDSGVELAAVRGTVTCNGKPLTEGMIFFNPEKKDPPDLDSKGGRGASAIIQSDGTFTLTTLENGDGAAIGPHSIRIAPASGSGESGVSDEDSAEDEDEEDEDVKERKEQAALKKLPCSSPANLTVEVKAGENVFQIEMSDGTATRVE